MYLDQQFICCGCHCGISRVFVRELWRTERRCSRIHIP